MKVIKVKDLIMKNDLINDVYFLDCISEEMIRVYFEKNRPIRVMDENKEISYINPKYIVAYFLYDELVDVEL